MENKIKNRIIAISGEPVSGKGTTIVKNEVLVDELISRVFNVIAEYNDTVVLTAR